MSRDGAAGRSSTSGSALDNNLAERVLRGPAIGRRLSFGSDSEDGAGFTAVMYSVVGTLALKDIDVLRWLEAWLETCAKNGRRPPDDLSPWLPWSMSEELRHDTRRPREVHRRTRHHLPGQSSLALLPDIVVKARAEARAVGKADTALQSASWALAKHFVCYEGDAMTSELHPENRIVVDTSRRTTGLLWRLECQCCT